MGLANNSFRHTVLHRDHTLDRRHDAWKLQQQPVTRGFHDPTAVVLDQSVNEFRSVCIQTL